MLPRANRKKECAAIDPPLTRAPATGDNASVAAARGCSVLPNLQQSKRSPLP
jgi:hypothetical protein